MGIQIKGSNDTISSADGSIVLEGATLTFTNENITGISTMASAQVDGNLDIVDKIRHVGDTDTAITFAQANTISAETGGSEALRIDSGQRLLIGHTATRAIAGGNSMLQIEKNSSELATFLRTDNGNGAAWLALAKSRSSAGAVCQAGDQVGGIAFVPHDGTDLNHHCAEIRAYVDTGIGGDDVPGYLTFNTNGGASTTTERLRIDSGGRLLLGATTSQEVYGTNALQIQGTTAATSGMSLLRQGGSPYLALGATGGSSLGAVNAVADDSRLGQLTFVGADGTDVNTHACSVAGYVDGSVSSNTVPGRLVFKTSTGASEVERMRILSTGEVNIGGNYTQTSAPLSVTTNANDYGYRLMTGSNVVMELLNNDSAGNCEMRGYYNNNSGTRAEGFRLESQGETFFNPGGNTGVSITADGKFCAGGTTVTTAPINVNTTAHYVVTSSGRSTNGIHIRGNGGNSGEYGGGISFGCNSDGAAAIAAEQMSSDVDVIGLSFFTRSSSTGSDDATKRVRIPSNGGIELHNWPSNTGFIFRSDATPPTTANVQSSNGRGICSGIVSSIAQNTATSLGNSHWGGLALVGYEGSGHQGYRLVAYGYGGAGVSVLFSGQWVGSLATTFTMSTYNLQVSHNSSNNLNFWLINLGV